MQRHDLQAIPEEVKDRSTDSRRFYIWAAAVLLIVLLLGVEALWPDWGPFPGLFQSMGSWSPMAVFGAALLCEYIDSSLGMGYGTTLTPLLLLAGFEPLKIVPAVLLSEFVTGISAGLLHHRDGNIDLRRDKKARHTALLLSFLSLAGVLAAVTLAVRISKFWLTAFIAIIILLMAVIILATSRRQLPYRRSHIIALGAVAAFNKGLSGGGYGPLVTGGQVVAGMAPKQAVAITSMAEGMTCFLGLIAYIIIQGSLDWSLAVPLTLGALLSVPMATLTVKKMPETIVRGCVGVVTLLLGLLTLVKLLT